MEQKKTITEIELPAFLKKELAEEHYTLDNIGMSDSQVLIFANKVLKIQKNSIEAKNEVAMLQWLSGKLPVPEVLYHTVENGRSFLLMSRVHGNMSCEKEYLDFFARYSPER